MRQLGREGVAVGRDRVARLMGELGLAGATRAKTTRTTAPVKQAQPVPADLVRRDFRASAPNRLWVTDLTYVPTGSGFAYTAFVTDACSRRIVGWQVSTSLQVELALDALEMAIWTRRGDALDGLVHHSDRGGQYLALRYTARLEEAGIVPSVGSKGDSFDNALAETVNGLYKAELIRRRGPWRDAARWPEPPPNGWPGGTPSACTAPWATSPRRSTRPPTGPRPPRPWPNAGGTFGNELVERCQTRTSLPRGPPGGALAGSVAPML